MGPVAIAAIGFGVQAGSSLLSGLLGGDGIEAARQAALERARRTNLGNLGQLGETRARAAASGAEMTPLTSTTQPGASSMLGYLSGMAQELRRENDWNVSQANRAADAAGDANLLNMFSGFGSSFFNFAKANNFWQAGPSYNPLSSLAGRAG